MEKLIIIITSSFLSFALFTILLEVFKISDLKAEKALLSMRKRSGKKKHSISSVTLDNISETIANKIAPYIFMDEIKEKYLQAEITAAGLTVSAKMYIALALSKAFIIFMFALIASVVNAACIPLVLVFPVAIYIEEIKKTSKRVKTIKKEIENELPRFVATLVQDLKIRRDVPSLLSTYYKYAKGSFKEQLQITIADMLSGNYEMALLNFEARVNSALLSDIVRGLIGVVRGDDNTIYFQMLAHDMKQLEVFKLKKEALKRPAKLMMCSSLALFVVVMMFFVIIGFEVSQSAQFIT